MNERRPTGVVIVPFLAMALIYMLTGSRAAAEVVFVVAIVFAIAALAGSTGRPQ